MGRSLGFASTTCDWGALFRLAFATATHRKCLTLPQTVTRRLIMQKARSHPFPALIFIQSEIPQRIVYWLLYIVYCPCGRHSIYNLQLKILVIKKLTEQKSGLSIGLLQLCKCMVSGTFNSLSKGAFHLSLALLFTIGCRGVLSLGGWAPQLHTEFHELRATLVRQP